MDIMIRTMNRPYCLDRCLRSLQKRVSGVGRIVVVDDGTPQPYIDELVTRWPDIHVEKSPNWEVKSELCATGGLGRQQMFETARQLPVGSWIRVARTLSDPFMLLEDDLWFVQDLDLDELESTMHRERLAMARLGTFGQSRTFPSPSPLAGPLGLEESHPRYLEWSRRFRPARTVFATKPSGGRSSRLAWKYARRLGAVGPDHWYHLWGIFSDSGSAFDKQYWLNVWNEDDSEVNESVQLDAALTWASEHPDARFARFTQDRVRTTYVSCATGRRWPDIGCDMYVFNRVMNEAWLRGEFDAELDLESEYDADSIVERLREADDENCAPEAWQEWNRRMVAQYSGI